MMEEIAIESEPIDKLKSHKSLTVNARNVRTVDMVKFFVNGNVDKARQVNLINDNKVNEKYFDNRWAFLVSVIARKIIVKLSGPMRCIGWLAYRVLNLTSANQGLACLLMNYVTGKLKEPKKEEEMSMIGHLDTRFELDANIKRDDPKYFPALCAMASKLAYENHDFIKNVVENTWKMKLVGLVGFRIKDFPSDNREKNTTEKNSSNDLKSVIVMLDDREKKTIDDHENKTNAFTDIMVEDLEKITKDDHDHEKNTTHALILEDGDRVIVAFRGTAVFDPYAWEMDADISWFKFKGAGMTHMGFMKALGLVETKDGYIGWPLDEEDNNHKKRAYYAIRKSLKRLLLGNNKKFILTGHSLGGALAVLFTAVLSFHGQRELLNRLEAIYTYGQPKVGNEKFGKFMEKIMMGDNADQTIKYTRFVYGADIVPRMPWGYNYKHFGTCIYFNSCYQAQIIKGDIQESYFSLWSVLLRSGIAAWEVVRSILIRLNVMKGLAYKESFLLALMRLMYPGVAAHALSDYINATLLASKY